MKNQNKKIQIEIPVLIETPILIEIPIVEPKVIEFFKSVDSKNQNVSFDVTSKFSLDFYC